MLNLSFMDILSGLKPDLGPIIPDLLFLFSNLAQMKWQLNYTCCLDKCLLLALICQVVIVVITNVITRFITSNNINMWMWALNSLRDMKKEVCSL